MHATLINFYVPLDNMVIPIILTEIVHLNRANNLFYIIIPSDYNMIKIMNKI